MDNNKESILSLLENCKGHLSELGIIPSPRVVSSITRYIEARPDMGGVETQDDGFEGDSFVRAFDEAFVQRILPKLLSSLGGYPENGVETRLSKLRDVLVFGDTRLKLCATFTSRLLRFFNSRMHP